MFLRLTERTVIYKKWHYKALSGKLSSEEVMGLPQDSLLIA